MTQTKKQLIKLGKNNVQDNKMADLTPEQQQEFEFRLRLEQEQANQQPQQQEAPQQKQVSSDELVLSLIHI